MKILFPIGMFYPTTVGGPSSTVYWHTCYLKRKHVKNYIVTTDFKLDYIKHNITLNKWTTSEAGNIIYCKTKFNGLPLKALFETIKKIRQVDIVHYSSAYYYLTIYTFLISVLYRKSIVISPRGEFFQNAIDSFQKRIVIKMYQKFQSKIRFHATSDSERERIRILFPKSEISLQPNYVKLRTRQKTTVRSKNIVFLGIIYPVKKIENIIKALFISKYFKEFDSKLIIAGKPLVKRDVDYLLDLEKLISKLDLGDKVEFIGEVFGKEKEEFLYNANVLILASETENFGNVVVEALAQSTPVIASLGTPWQVLEESDAGWWVDNEPVSISKAIDTALNLSEENYLKKSQNALQLMRNNYDINTSPANKWLKIYKDLIDE